MKRLLLLCFLCLPVLAGAASCEIANKSLCEDARRGDATAQFLLGEMYFSGQGVKQDYYKAFLWVQKAAEQGNAKAQRLLGVMYYGGYWVKQDYHKAFLWTQKAAKQGNATAQMLLGIMYNGGQGVRQDYIKAKEWFGKSCDRGLQLGCDLYRGLNEKGL